MKDERMAESEVRVDELSDYRCPITGAVMFDPVQADCKHKFERSAIEKWLSKNDAKSCPCCRHKIERLQPVDVAFEIALCKMSDDPKVLNEVYFDLDKFADIVSKNKLYAATGQRFIALLRAENHLNDLATEGVHRGKSAIQLLASTLTGREFLRKKLRKVVIADGSEQFFLGRAKISDASLKTQVEGRSILEWLQLRDEKNNKQPSIFLKCFNFFSRPKNTHSNCDAVNPILQDVVNGKREEVQKKLEALKNSNPKLLATVLTSTATKPIVDDSGRVFENVTLLEAAAFVGDVAVNSGYQGMCEIILSCCGSDASVKENVLQQLKAVFPNGVKAHVEEQEKTDNVFDFFPVMVAIDRASSEDVKNALEKKGASFFESSDAQLKSGSELTLVEALNRFREQLRQCVLSEKIFNPYHLLKAMHLYDAQYNNWNSDKKDLFACQVIGFVERYLPPNYAQLFAHGFIDLVESNKPVPDRIVFECGQEKSDHFYSNACDGLGFDYMVLGRARKTVPSLMTHESKYLKLISIKSDKLEEMMSGSYRFSSRKMSS